MKKVTFLKDLILSLVIAAAPVACEKGLDFSKLDPFRFDEANPGTIKGQVYNGSNYNAKISTVRAVSDMLSTRSTQEMSTRVAPTGEAVATADWSGGNFTLSLPSTVDESKLRNSEEVFGSLFGFDFRYEYALGFEQIYESVARSYCVRLAAYDAAGDYFDDLVLYNSRVDDDLWVYFLYVEREVSVLKLGTTPPTLKKLYKKGWNIVYIGKVIGENEAFTYKPTGDWYWLLSRDLPYDDVIARE